MKSACEKKRSELMAVMRVDPVAQHLYTVVDTFIEAQQQRHTADYDNPTQWTRTEVLDQITAVNAAFQSWKTIRNENLAQDYLVYLFVRER